MLERDRTATTQVLKPSVVVVSLACTLAFLAAAGIAASSLPFQSFLGIAIGSNHADQVLRGVGIIAQNFRSIAARLRYFSAAMLAVATLLFVGRQQAAIWIEEVIFPIPRFIRVVMGSIMRTLKRTRYRTSFFCAIHRRFR